MSDREVIGKRWLDVVVADFTPAIEPVDVGHAVRWTTHATPFRLARNRAELIVLREQLRRGVIQRGSLQTFDFAVAGDEAFGVVTHAEVELVDDVRIEHAYPVRRPAVVLVEVMRIDAPAIVVIAGPA